MTYVLLYQCVFIVQVKRACRDVCCPAFAAADGQGNVSIYQYDPDGASHDMRPQ